ncbi:hypothetical protein EYF80_015577 [Liparis tanakae]|uniref:Uncharacterized protein n=1 Tax=Liparis tanakae TaxID=230148 RepID=A0A4Z2I9R1_9TELE|nr:hypothetical protein EYF80_015577 [Liparis tanakae]
MSGLGEREKTTLYISSYTESRDRTNKHNPQQAIGSKASENTRHTDHKAVLPPTGTGPTY